MIEPAFPPGADDDAPDTKTKLQFTPTIATTKWLAMRDYLAGDQGPLSRRAKSDLELFRQMLGLELARIRLTLPEVRALAGVLAKTPLSFEMGTKLGIVFQEMHDAIRYAREDGWSLGQQVGFDEDKLMAKLEALGPAADMALRQALANWAADWVPGTEPDNSAETFARFGLRVVPDTQSRAA